MHCDHDKLVLKVADLILELRSDSDQILFDAENSLLHYRINNFTRVDFHCNFILKKPTISNIQDWSFIGKPENNGYLNYSWRVKSTSEKIFIQVDFDDHNQLKSLLAIIQPGLSKIEVEVEKHIRIQGPIYMDPLIHPLGSLLLLYMFHLKGGVLMHASAVIDYGNSYLFSGVSGIGKSTMARLWFECGGDVINDDRVVLRLQDDVVKIYNNPMPYYQQYPKEGVLKKIFLLKQSPENYIRPVSGVNAYSRVLGNFIQQFYEKEMVNKHLDYILKILDRVSVYEVGFKPDQEIVSLIRSLD
ncbi:hypothetical protein [Plebeiibacterium sediminum]|uniref:Uncharacterized protein n=1 Tax=Plebeiibacterium sediminum TaxID=2992112 RepID=A0AAE3M339_9BACT|nr:hypothetical protein [Plebeiobacterium sediminum]MCW3785915.1 hypothetical protein [Plebeiobacterium sediminum]